MKNVLRKLLLIVATGIALAASACDSNDTAAQTQIVNPASLYCEQAGGTHFVEADVAGYLGNIWHQLKP